MRYRYLLADNDNTLMDFNAAEKKSLQGALGHFSKPFSEEIFQVYHHINDLLWKALERGETTQAELKIERFAQLCRHYGWSDIDAKDLAVVFQDNLSTHADLLPGAMHLLQTVHGRMKIALVSNGVSATQRGRLSVCEFTHLLDAIVISEEIGVSKPNPLMVEKALEMLGCTDKREAVFLGDSHSADVAAAWNAGVDSIWLTRHGKGQSDKATYIVESLEEAEALLLQ
ncbi:MAG: noncanonical pyrimidine nucleotidase, YjjG family [Clostridiales bacterium]|nr:noncanonical pyrimidine nucleotidase, YjjG family [Clostridiales bacterium]